MIMIPSGMADSGGGSVETVVLTDPLDSRHPRQAHGQVQMAIILAFNTPVASSIWRIDFERAVVEWLRKRSQS
ncbi:hypothetical protein [Microvirga sp. 2TAF3]|uniref:hypothetical protein n=1 Tax=Microvirga sp. 2TAF3 TaxID=3233014 RepID=UPI003F9467F1